MRDYLDSGDDYPAYLRYLARGPDYMIFCQQLCTSRRRGRLAWFVVNKVNDGDAAQGLEDEFARDDDNGLCKSTLGCGSS